MVYNKRVRSLRGRIKGVEGWEGVVGLSCLGPVMGKHPDLMVAHPTSTIFPTIGRNF
jgi:hypothetical protein